MAVKTTCYVVVQYDMDGSLTGVHGVYAAQVDAQAAAMWATNESNEEDEGYTYEIECAEFTDAP